jgi:hypothetical protein
MDEEIRKKYFSHVIDKPKKEKTKTKKPKNIPLIVKQIQTHNLKEINYAFEKSISYSQVSMFLNCPLKWSLQYKDGYYQSESSIHMTFGTALHEAIQHYITNIYENSGAAADRIDMEQYFEERFRETYLKDYKSNKKIHFSDPIEMREFYEDGLAILDYIKKKRVKYFGKKGWYLVGCELPLLINPHPQFKNILYKGYLDVVLYHEPTNTFKIIDIKTSKQGWDDKTKKNEIKTLQLILYKKFYSQQFGIPEDNIEVEFFIVKRKVWEESPYPISRIQEFKPANGKGKINKAVNTINLFIESVFNHDGSYKDKTHDPKLDDFNCKYCSFANTPHCPSTFKQ